MNARRGFGLIWGLLTVAIAGTVAWFAYHAGLATTVVNSGATGSAAVPPDYYYHYGTGGFFGIFPLLFLILLIVFLFRGRRHRGWGYGGGWGHGWGYGPPWGWGGPGQPAGPGQPGGPQGADVPPAMEERLKAWHEKAHGASPEPDRPS
jgi:hypothetical protein